MYDVDPDGCWIWRAGGNGHGYGATPVEMRREGFHTAHRWFYAQANGGVCPDTLDHLCRNRRCVNPDHLEPCSRGENVRRGDVAKLTWEKVADLRASAASMCGSQREIARRLAPVFGISEGGVRSVLRGVRWPESDRPKVA